jgi:hypothetical protein
VRGIGEAVAADTGAVVVDIVTVGAVGNTVGVLVDMKVDAAAVGVGILLMEDIELA